MQTTDEFKEKGKEVGTFEKATVSSPNPLLSMNLKKLKMFPCKGSFEPLNLQNYSSGHFDHLVLVSNSLSYQKVSNS
jgi:hypothetical protein